MIEDDGIKIANYCDASGEKNRVIYFVQTSDLIYESAIYAYLKQEIIYLTEAEADEMVFEDAIVICSDSYKIKQDSRDAEVDTQVVRVFEVD